MAIVNTTPNTNTPLAPNADPNPPMQPAAIPGAPPGVTWVTTPEEAHPDPAPALALPLTPETKPVVLEPIAPVVTPTSAPKKQT